MRSQRRLLVVCASSVLAACSIGRPSPPTITYVIELREGMSSDRYLTETLRMGTVRVAAPFASRSLVYRFNDVRYDSDPYHAFASEPGAMLGGRIAGWLNHAGPFRSVSQPGSAQTARYVLEASVTDLYGDFREGRAPAAVLAIQFALIDQGGLRPKTLYERSFTRSIDLPKASAEGLVGGYDQALLEMLAQVVSDLKSQLTNPVEEVGTTTCKRP